MKDYKNIDEEELKNAAGGDSRYLSTLVAFFDCENVNCELHNQF